MPEGKQPTPGMRARVNLETVGFGDNDWTVSITGSAHSSEEQANVNAAHVNRLLEADERRREVKEAPQTAGKQPTPGIRLDIDQADGELNFMIEHKLAYLYTDREQAQVNVTYINWLIETDERRREAMAKEAAQPSDLIVDMGNLKGARIDKIPLDADYESMVEDLLGNFNHIIMQGIPPLTAVYAMSQAFALVLGYALRADLPWAMAQEILKQQMQSAKAACAAVRIITTKQ